jgi:predicted transcriptional regulator
VTVHFVVRENGPERLVISAEIHFHDFTNSEWQSEILGSSMKPVAPRSPAPTLGRLERRVLEHLWSAGEADVIETHAAVGARSGISANTVGSALERLHRKGLLSRRKVSHAYRYQPALTRDEFLARQVIAGAGGLGSLTRQGLLASFVDIVARTDREALREMERLIAEKRREKRR